MEECMTGECDILNEVYGVQHMKGVLVIVQDREGGVNERVNERESNIRRRSRLNG